jgi:hypothetical protein
MSNPTRKNKFKEAIPAISPNPRMLPEIWSLPIKTSIKIS